MDHVDVNPWPVYCLKRVCHVTYSYKDTIPMRDSLSVRLGPRISLFQFLQCEWARELPHYKNCLVNNLSIDLPIITHMIHLCIPYLSTQCNAKTMLHI